ncbi:MAG: type III-A CRISPR-associated RAMP protein Csm4 [Bacteroidales bacterium]|nr:type III-A CRISPR-associated RAMP protein Csm4 [Bacteroidales bacterium]
MKHNFTIFRLHFTAPLHLGNEREDYAESLGIIHSDSLYAALTAALFKVGWQPPEKFEGHLGFTISSLFPFYQKKEESPVYFFPKSRKQEIMEEGLLEDHKKIKKIKWLDKEFFEAYTQGKSMQELYSRGKNGKKDENKYLKGDYFTKDAIPENFISKQVFPRVTVSRNGKDDAEPFYMERLFFSDHSGMFFLAEGDTTLLEKALTILEQEGIGTDRNVGNGFFEYKKDTLELELPDNSNYQMNLSLFLPSDKEHLKEQLDNQAAYAFKKRGGWVSTPPYNTIRKNRIYMFEEGSLFQSEADNPVTNGRIVNLKPDASKLPKDLQGIHDIWRNGKAIFIPFKPS